MQKAIITLVSVFLILIVLLFFFGFSKIEKPPVDSLDQTSYINFGEPLTFHDQSEIYDFNGYESILLVYQLRPVDDSGNLNLYYYVVYRVSVPEKNTSFFDYLAQPSNYNKPLNISKPYSPFFDRFDLFGSMNIYEPFVNLDSVGDVEFNTNSLLNNGEFRLNFSGDYYVRMPLTIDNVINPINIIAEYLNETRPNIFEDMFQDVDFDEEFSLRSIFDVLTSMFKFLFALFWEWPNWILKHILLYFDYFGAVFLW